MKGGWRGGGERWRGNVKTDESTHKGVNQRSKYVTQVQQQRPESPKVTHTWQACKYKVHKLHQRYVRFLEPRSCVKVEVAVLGSRP